jgi:hypothetical protein
MFRATEGGMTHEGANGKFISIDREPIKSVDIIYVDQMGRFCHPKRHNRHKALSAGKNAAMFRSNFGKDCKSFFDGAGSVTNECRCFHWRDGALWIPDTFRC